MIKKLESLFLNNLIINKLSFDKNTVRQFLKKIILIIQGIYLNCIIFIIEKIKLFLIILNYCLFDFYIIRLEINFRAHDKHTI